MSKIEFGDTLEHWRAPKAFVEWLSVNITVFSRGWLDYFYPAIELPLKVEIDNRGTQKLACYYTYDMDVPFLHFKYNAKSAYAHYLAGKLDEFYRKVVVHELCHAVCHQLGKEYSDGDAYFEAMIKKHDSCSSDEVSPKEEQSLGLVPCFAQEYLIYDITGLRDIKKGKLMDRALLNCTKPQFLVSQYGYRLLFVSNQIVLLNAYSNKDKVLERLDYARRKEFEKGLLVYG